jgi:hypothetical protein
MRLWNTKTNDSALLNLRATDDLERNARLANLEHKITGTNNEMLTGPIHVNPRKHIMERDQYRTISQHSHSCIKNTQRT